MATGEKSLRSGWSQAALFKKRRAIRARGGVKHVAQGRVFHSHERGSEEGPEGEGEADDVRRKGPLSEASPAKRLVNKEPEAQVTGSPGLGGGQRGRGKEAGPTVLTVPLVPSPFLPFNNRTPRCYLDPWRPNYRFISQCPLQLGEARAEFQPSV